MNGKSNFFSRLSRYYGAVGRALAGESDASSIFSNKTDIGESRELMYAQFLERHLCNVFQGGFLFNEEGEESKQLDLLVTTDMSLQYNLHYGIGGGKSFSCVDGALAAISLKSKLDSGQLHDALLNLASIPRQSNPQFIAGSIVFGYQHWPFKIVYAPEGVALSTTLKSLNKFYKDHPDIPPTRRPDLIHVLGKYVVLYEARPLNGQRTGEPSEFMYTGHPDTSAFAGLSLAITMIQLHLAASRNISFNFTSIFSRVAPHLAQLLQ